MQISSITVYKSCTILGLICKIYISSICFLLMDFKFLKYVGEKPVTFLNWLLKCDTLL